MCSILSMLSVYRKTNLLRVSDMWVHILRMYCLLDRLAMSIAR